MFPREVFVMKIHVISFNENLWEIDKIKVLKNLDFKQYVLIERHWFSYYITMMMKYFVHQKILKIAIIFYIEMKAHGNYSRWLSQWQV